MSEEVTGIVLLVEDNPVHRQVTAACLKMIHCKVIEAKNGIEALQRIDELIPDVIICDLMMPEIGGAELLRELHANPETEGIPFIVLSALSSDEEKVAA